VSAVLTPAARPSGGGRRPFDTGSRACTCSESDDQLILRQLLHAHTVRYDATQPGKGDRADPKQGQQHDQDSRDVDLPDNLVMPR